ncbi:MarR family winged helix-turn-helix transcriptional regulator [Streptomyces phaeofaciens]|uniref:MarR family winged helix-turn-helix transcriptional regulator n=1 Tax=Streptomyces phaeofaciens TaxID=68254 RepID=UPI00369DC205
MLAVHASHVTRQVRRLQRTGRVTRVADPDDSRARRIRRTPLGEDAVARLGDAGARGMRPALSHGPPDELRRLAGLLGRMVDVLLTHSADEGQDSDAGTTTTPA